MGRLGIHTSSVDVKSNQLLLGVEDDSDDAKREISTTLSQLGYTDTNMYRLEKMPRTETTGSFDFSGNPVDMSNGVPDRLIDAARDIVYIAPGSWLGQGSSISSITGVSSLCTGFLYNGTPGYLSCGHGKMVGMKIFYQPVPSSGSYPSNLFDYNTSDLVEIGQVAAAYWNSGDAYDCASILATNSNCIMDSNNFCGAGINGDGGVPEVGEMMAMCGCADGAGFGACVATSATVIFTGGIIKTDMLRMNYLTTSGSSGGCVVYQDGSTAQVILTGLVAGANGIYYTHSKYGLVKSRFNLTTVF